MPDTRHHGSERAEGEHTMTDTMTRIHIVQNAWGNWYGYAGDHHLKSFSGESAEQDAHEWLNREQAAQILFMLGRETRRSVLGHAYSYLHEFDVYMRERRPQSSL